MSLVPNTLNQLYNAKTYI